MWQISISPRVKIKNHSSIKTKLLDYFKIIIKIFEISKSWGTWQNTTCSNCSQKKLHYLVPNNNMYMVNQMMKVYFVDLSFHPKFLVTLTSVTCDLSNATIKILVTNVASIKN